MFSLNCPVTRIRDIWYLMDTQHPFLDRSKYSTYGLANFVEQTISLAYLHITSFLYRQLIASTMFLCFGESVHEICD